MSENGKNAQIDKLHPFLKDKLLKYEFTVWKSCLPISFMLSIGCMRRIKSLCILSWFKDASQKAEFRPAGPSLYEIPLFEPCRASEILEVLPLPSAWVRSSMQSMLTSHPYFLSINTFFSFKASNDCIGTTLKWGPVTQVNIIIQEELW